MMSQGETKSAEMLAARVVGGMKDMTCQQRVAILAELQRHFCNVCGEATATCKCFDRGF